MTSIRETSSSKTVGRKPEPQCARLRFGEFAHGNQLMHDGLSLTFNEAILRHGGEALQVKLRYQALIARAKEAVDNVPRVAVIRVSISGTV